MKLYAFEVKESDAELLTLLNQGVYPQPQAVPTYLIVDATWNTEVPNEIVTEEELISRFQFIGRPHVISIQ